MLSRGQHETVRGREQACRSARTHARGVPGGNRAQRLCPAASAFQALVASGSTWRALPLRAGPITNHLLAGISMSAWPVL